MTGYVVQRRYRAVCLIGFRRGNGTSILGVEELPHSSRQGACTDRECEESSVLAAGVISKAADVGFIDAVQE